MKDDDRTTPGSGEGADTFERWYRAHHKRVLGQCRRLLNGDAAAAEDIAQETLLRAWLGRERMREEDIGAWLTVVARNLCISHVRRQKKQIPTEVLPETLDESADPAHLVERLESRRAVRRAMRGMGDRHRKLLLLREIEGVDYEELGTELGLTAGGTRTVLFRARRVLRDRLAAVGEGLGGWIVGVRVRTGIAVRRVQASLSPLETSASSVFQAGIAVALAAGLSLPAASVVQSGTLPASSRSVAASFLQNTGSSSQVGSGAPSSSELASSTSQRSGRGAGRGGNGGPVGVDFGYDPATHNKDLEVSAGPVKEENHSRHYDDPRPCIMCTPESIVFAVLCSQRPEYCKP